MRECHQLYGFDVLNSRVLPTSAYPAFAVLTLPDPPLCRKPAMEVQRFTTGIAKGPTIPSNHY
ncbi:MAG: hypothetical protein ACXAEU_15890 [Candidatus Hodarchaeales archaeon]